MRFIKQLRSEEIPKDTFGRVTRITFDLDDSEVHDYVLHGGESSEPWPVMVVRELTDELMEWAQREDFMARLIARRAEP